MVPFETYVLVVNPISGDLDKSEMKQLVIDMAARRGLGIYVLETDGKHDRDRIQEAFKHYNPARVLVAGGDGTIKMVAEALEAFEVIFGLIPAGSANGLSVDLDLPDDLEAIVSIALEGEPIDADMVSINDIRSIHLSDIGLNASLVKNYEQGSVRGKLGYALQTFTTLKDDDRPFQVCVEANGQRLETEARMVAIANSQKYGTGVTINPFGKMDDGKFEIVVLKTFDMVLLGKIVTGNMPLDTGEIEIISTDQAIITTDLPVHFQVDGEYCGEVTRMEAKILTGRLRIARA